MSKNCYAAEQSKVITVALIGQPNVGKSTLFTKLTGKYSHIANWPGTTVEIKEGVTKHRGAVLHIFDLPGVYGLSASSIEEVVARSFIVERRPDVVVILVDSLAPERTMYLAIQILELYPRAVIVFTKVDAAHSNGIHIHFDKIESRLGVPVVAVSAVKGYGIRELLDLIIDVAEGRKGRNRPLEVPYGQIEPFIRELEQILAKSKLASKYPVRWLAVRLLEGDEYLVSELEEANEREILSRVNNIRENFVRVFGRDPVEILASYRYSFIDKILHDCVVRVGPPRVTRLVAILDSALKHRVIGPALSLAILFAVFTFVFTINTGFPLNILAEQIGSENIARALETYSLSGLLSTAFSHLAELAEMYIPGLPGRIISEGIIKGVGAVLSFFPLILLVSVMLALLEDSGLASRFAYALHSLLSRFGLSGRSAFPILVAFGCNVPAVLCSRTALDEVERVQLITSLPFIPCQARLVVLLALTTSLFGNVVYQSLALVIVYIVALAAMLAVSLLVRRVVFREKESPELIIELPPIHRPSLRVVWWSAWDLAKHFLVRAGVIILGLSLVMWTLLNFGPEGAVTSTDKSYAALVGRVLSPLIEAYGIPADKAWIIALALISGLIAKETFLTVLVLASGQPNISLALRSLSLTIPQALGIMVLVTLYLPCIATLAVMYQETRSLKYTLGAFMLMLTLAYMLSVGITYASKLILGC